MKKMYKKKKSTAMEIDHMSNEFDDALSQQHMEQ